MNLQEGDSEHWRVSDPAWDNPFDGTYAMRIGQRWNLRASFETVYLNADRATATTNARLMIAAIEDLGVALGDLEDSELPLIYPCTVPSRTVLDVVSDEGCRDAGLPDTYPIDDLGNVISHAACQPIGQYAWDSLLDGVAARSAAPGGTRELAWFPKHGGALVASGPPERFDPRAAPPQA